MKKIEGDKIAQDLLKRIQKIEVKIEEIYQKSTGLIGEYVVKLEKRIKEILKTNEVDESRLAQEVVIQEMNRETNTIGSKANNLDITNGVIDIKTELEDIREQVQNIE